VYDSPEAATPTLELPLQDVIVRKEVRLDVASIQKVDVRCSVEHRWGG
jgi:hypothetical protein